MTIDFGEGDNGVAVSGSTVHMMEGEWAEEIEGVEAALRDILARNGAYPSDSSTWRPKTKSSSSLFLWCWVRKMERGSTVVGNMMYMRWRISQFLYAIR